MIRQSVRSLVLLAAGLLLAGGAWGQVLRQTTSADFNVALEYFGAESGREVLVSKIDLVPDDPNAQNTIGVQRTYVALEVDDSNIDSGNVGNISFTVGGATFSQTVAPADLDLRSACTSSDTVGNLSVSVDSGGARGDSAVTFRVEATSALTDGQFICFWVPDLLATLTTVSAPGVDPAEMGVDVTASITQGVTNSAPFPTAINGINVDHDNDASTDTVPGPITDKVLFKAVPALATSLGRGAVGYVNIADRTKIALGGTPDPSAANPRTATKGVSVGALSIAPATGAATIHQLDGGGFVVANGRLDSSLGGQVKLTVSGPFQSGDKVVVGSGPDARQLTAEDGAAETAVQLEVGGPTSIVYVPGGGILKPSTFATSAKYSFNNLNNNNDVPIEGAVGMIKYAGIDVEGYAYGVVKAEGVESSTLRITCEAPAKQCAIFADCTDQGGMSHFAPLSPIDAGTTDVVSSNELAMALGGGWDSGRGRCDIYSTHPLAVQHMVRTGGHAINNSTVVGRGLDEQTDDVVEGKVKDICDSVGDGDGQQDGSPTTADPNQNYPTDNDTICQPVDLLKPPASSG